MCGGKARWWIWWIDRSGSGETSERLGFGTAFGTTLARGGAPDTLAMESDPSASSEAVAGLRELPVGMCALLIVAMDPLPRFRLGVPERVPAHLHHAVEPSMGEL